MVSANDAKVGYLSNDYLDSPRVNTDRDGNVTARHDYLPFGEELTNMITSQRTTSLFPNDTVRKKFTGYERDDESGVDYAEARMYTPNLGRFTRPDPLLSSARAEDPQSWNKYSYVSNRALTFTDPWGMYVCTAQTTKTQCEQFEAARQKALAALAKIKDPKEYKKAERAIKVFGEPGVRNGVTVGARATGEAGSAATAGVTGKKTADNPTGQDIRVEFRADWFSKESFYAGVVHEGSHAADGSDWVKSGFKNAFNPTDYETEFNAYTAESIVLQANDAPAYAIELQHNKPLPRFVLWEQHVWHPSWPAWANADMSLADRRRVNIDNILAYDKRYGYTPKTKTKTFLKGSKF